MVVIALPYSYPMNIRITTRKAALSAPSAPPPRSRQQGRAARGARPRSHRRRSVEPAARWLMPLGEIYIKLAVNFANDPKVRALARFGAPDAGLARDLFVQMVCHCKAMLTDGFVSAEQVGLLVYPLDLEHGNQLAKQLASVGLIKESSNGEAQGWEVLAYVKRNGTREDVERLSQVRAEAGRKGGRPAGQTTRKANRNQVAKQNKSRPNPYTETESDTETEDQNTPAIREDVERLCLHLADRIEGNGSKRPTITQDWRDAARLMIDRDKRTEEQIRTAIDWCQDDEFWMRNVMSMPTLRKQYDRLRLAAQQQQRGTPARAAAKQVNYTDEEYTSGW